MRKMGTARLAMTFAGCFLGAGFVSGQELWQFFGCFGLQGFWGLIAASVGLLLFGVFLLRLAQMTGITEMDRIVVPGSIPWLRGLAAALQIVTLFGIMSIMIAGTGALVHQLTGAPHWLPDLVIVVLAGLAAMKGVRGMVAVFSAAVPVIVLATVAFGAAAVARFGVDARALTAQGSQNPLLPNWIAAAATYVSYNIFGTIGILTPLGKLLRSRKTVYVGTALGTLCLLAVAGGILLALAADPAAAQAELPMLAVAARLGGAFGYVYGLLLLLGMFGTALSCLVAVRAYLEKKIRLAKRHPAGATAVLCAAAFGASLAGFGDLISVLYPGIGYLSIAALISLIVSFFRARRDRTEETISR